MDVVRPKLINHRNRSWSANHMSVVLVQAWIFLTDRTLYFVLHKSKPAIKMEVGASRCSQDMDFAKGHGKRASIRRPLRAIEYWRYRTRRQKRRISVRISKFRIACGACRNGGYAETLL